MSAANGVMPAAASSNPGSMVAAKLLAKGERAVRRALHDDELAAMSRALATLAVSAATPDQRRGLHSIHDHACPDTHSDGMRQQGGLPSDLDFSAVAAPANGTGALPQRQWQTQPQSQSGRRPSPHLDPVDYEPTRKVSACTLFPGRLAGVSLCSTRAPALWLTDQSRACAVLCCAVPLCSTRSP